MTRAASAVGTGAAIASGLAVALWLGGLVALGAVTAPIVFAVAPMPQSADAMTMVFRRFDMIAMTCAAVVLASEAARVIARVPFRRLDHARAAVSVLAAGVTTYEGMNVSPRIAELHVAGAVRGVGAAGLELSRLHDTAEVCGKTAVVLLAALVILQAAAASSGRGRGDGAPVA
jgi:uncharacterized membrane protein